MAKTKVNVNNEEYDVVVKETAAKPEKVKVVEETTSKKVTGTVFNCEQLNVRKTANLKGEIVCIVKAGTNLIVNEEKSNAEWLCVSVNSVKECYCMKQFIKINA